MTDLGRHLVARIVWGRPGRARPRHADPLKCTVASESGAHGAPALPVVDQDPGAETGSAPSLTRCLLRTASATVLVPGEPMRLTSATKDPAEFVR